MKGFGVPASKGLITSKTDIAKLVARQIRDGPAGSLYGKAQFCITKHGYRKGGNSGPAGR
jgi:hypothetical protein